jgi:hypothetical protein
MSHANQVAELLLRWEELSEEGKHVSVEELCRECPELLDEVRGKMQALRAMDRVPNRVDDTVLQADGQATSTEALPRLPGYEVLETIGSGGMGKVYKARQIGLNRLVALKMILSGVHARPAELARFRTEAEAVARLQHPNIVQVFDVGAHDGVPFLALEYVGGGTLAQHLGGRPLPPRPAAEVVLALARAMHYAHEHGVIHRDLKPANVLLVSGEGSKTPRPQAAEKTGATTHHSPLTTHQPKIADFGLARKIDEAGQTQSGAVLGTPNYMAPEQAAGKIKEIGPATDVYALGAILYECLTGRPPFGGDSLVETLEQVRHHDPEPPRHLVPRVPRDLEVICLTCLEKEPARRYPSARALAEDLERHLAGEWVEARGATVVGTLKRVLDRSQPIARVRHGPVRFFAWPVLPLPFVATLLFYVLAAGQPYYGPVSLLVCLGAIGAMLVVAYCAQRTRSLEISAPVLRQLWSIRFGMLLAIATLTAMSYLATPAGQPWNALAVFPQIAVLCGLLFFVMGGLFWGRLYLVGLGFFALALLLPLYVELAPVVLAFLLSTALFLLAFKIEGQNRGEH